MSQTTLKNLIDVKVTRSMSLDKKLDIIFESLNILNANLNQNVQTTKAIEDKLNKLLKEDIPGIQLELTNVTADLKSLKAQVANNENEIANYKQLITDKCEAHEQEIRHEIATYKQFVSDKCEAYEKDIRELKKNVLEKEAQDEIKNVLAESYDKRLNLLIHGLPESEDAWESSEKCTLLVRDFLKRELKVESADSMFILDAHRLPRARIASLQLNNGKPKVRPVIFKLATAFDKNTIMSHLKYLKDYTVNVNKSKPYITQHLPMKFQKEKKAPASKFKTAWIKYKDTGEKRHKPKWVINSKTGEYCVCINNEYTSAKSL